MWPGSGSDAAQHGGRFCSERAGAPGDRDGAGRGSRSSAPRSRQALAAAAALLEYLFRANFGIDELLGAGYVTTQTSNPGRMSPATALCFLVLATGFVLAQTSLLTDKSAVLGVTGLLVAAVGATCFIGIVSGTSDALAWGNSRG